MHSFLRWLNYLSTRLIARKSVIVLIAFEEALNWGRWNEARSKSIGCSRPNPLAARFAHFSRETPMECLLADYIVKKGNEIFTAISPPDKTLNLVVSHHCFA